MMQSIEAMSEFCHLGAANPKFPELLTSTLATHSTMLQVRADQGEALGEKCRHW